MKTPPTRTSQKHERGQTLIEFAFIAPVIMVLLLTILDFGLALDHREVLQHAVREGTRQGAVGASTLEITNVTVAQSEGYLEASDVTVCYVDGTGGAPNAGIAGSNVRVSATDTYQLFFGSELLTAFGVPAGALSIELNPSAESRMETSLAGVTEC